MIMTYETTIWLDVGIMCLASFWLGFWLAMAIKSTKGEQV